MLSEIVWFVFEASKDEDSFWTQFREVKYLPHCLTLTGYVQFVAIY